MLLSACAAVASVQLIPVIASHGAGVNFGTTRLGKAMLKADTDYFFGDICNIAYMLFTFIIVARVMKSERSSASKAAISAAVLYSNYLLVFPLISVTNMMLRPFCDNGPMNLDKMRYFPRSRVLEDNFATIRNEVVAFMDERRVPCLNELRPNILLDTPTDGRCWRFVALKKMNQFNELYRDAMPKLYQLLDSDEISTAVISSLDPETEIPPHKGYSKAFIRYHLALEAPTDNPAYIVCGGEKYVWKEGEGVCFDDMFVHHVINPSKKRRTVLYLDINRTDCPLQSVIAVHNYIVENSTLLKVFIKDQHIPTKISNEEDSG
jgi:aspartyl/asparaginyl beta-hydroxylase (cupin superfamily)